MHQSALIYGKCFFEIYCSGDYSEKIIVDIGALNINGSLREFSPNGAKYIGVDFEKGTGVDIILTDPYKLPFDDESVDIIVCSSVLEHSEFFWLLFLECIRVLKPQGLLYINAPSNGKIHRYPIDGWRFYPDAGHALIHWAQRNHFDSILLESFIGNKMGSITDDGFWNDFVAVILKDKNFQELFPSRILKSKDSFISGFNSQWTNIFELENLNPDYRLIIENQNRIASLEKTVVERDGQIARLALEVDVLRKSWSWRLTKPVRFLGHQISQCKKLLLFATAALRLAGGPGTTFMKMLNLFFHDGFRGVRRGIHMVQTYQGVRPTSGSDGFDRNDYAEWVRRYDTLTELACAKMRAKQAGFLNKPIISVIMPCYNPRPEWLIEAIESVKNQIYPYWELCIADDASSDPAIRQILERYASQDPRIKIVMRPQNGHISEASNSAFELATGQWLALLDHDDILPKHALFWVAHSIDAHPDARMIYSDEDKIDEAGRRFNPYFKGDWNVDLFYAHNMFCHLGVYQTALFKAIGGFRKGYEGSQDYDLTLRFIERILPTQIHHIPRVLYHWRAHAESTARAADAKPYALIAGERAINEHFERTGVNGRVKITRVGYEPNYLLPANPPLVTIVIPTRNGFSLLKRCIDSLFSKTTYPNFEILVVDNGSDDTATIAYLKKLNTKPKVQVIRDDGAFNYSRLNNMAIKQAKGELVALLNNDIEVITPDWLSIMVGHALRPGIGAVGAKLWYPNNTLQHGGVILGLGGIAGHAHSLMPKGEFGYYSKAALTQNISAVTAACLVIRKTTYLEVDGLNETELTVALNDVDFCLRVREAGYRNLWTPLAELYHHESATRGSDATPVNKARFEKECEFLKRRWSILLQNDPAYNPNLTLDHADFSLAWPPRTPSV